MNELLSIRRAVLEGLKDTPLVARTLAGDPDLAAYARYLTNVWHYAQHSATVIALAGARCVASHPPLAEYLLHHAQEELGHERWALDDLGALGVSAEDVRRTRPVPACAAMIGFEYYTAAHDNPVGIFGWLYVLEAMGDDLGSLAADALRRGLGRAEGLKFLAGHAEADVAHTNDLTTQIGAQVRGTDLEDVVHVARVVGDLYVRMFREIAAG
jgi:pyrroloquinoline quinone (PQQ) biosynthesis protein C